jgi:hypothetical protein
MNISACSPFTEADLQLRLLGCGDGPAGFNAVLTRQGGKAVSLDPVYAFDAAQIRSRIADTYETVMAQMYLNRTSEAPFLTRLPLQAFTLFNGWSIATHSRT